MRGNRASIAPSTHNQINSLPEWKICGVGRSDVIEQPHPKYGERLVIKIFHVMVRGERANFFPHPLKGLIRRHLGQVAQCHGNVGDVGEFRRGNRRGFEGVNQGCDFGVAGKIFRFHVSVCGGVAIQGAALSRAPLF